MNELIAQDAREYGLHVKQGGWRLGLLVARNVEKGKGQGSKPRNDRNEGEKVSAQEFGRLSGTSAPRVLRHLDAWEKAAAAEVKGIPAAATLAPGDEVKLDADKLPDWSEFYTAVGGGFNGSKTRLAHNPGQFAQAFASLPEEQKEMVAQEIAQRDDFAKAVKSDPVVRDTLVGNVADPAKAKEAAQEAQRNLIGKHALLGWAAVADGFGEANLGLTHALNALVKLAINARINRDDDALDVAHLRAEKIARSIFEIEMAAGENLITDRIAELKEGVPS